MLRHTCFAIAAIVAALAGSGQAEAQSGKQDCIVNLTGSDVWVTLAWIDQSFTVFILDGETFNFGVPDDSIHVALAAYQEDGTLLALTSFDTLPQDPPPGSCLAIEKTTGKKLDKRQKSKHAEAKRGAVPTFRKSATGK